MKMLDVREKIAFLLMIFASVAMKQVGLAEGLYFYNLS